MQLADWHGMPPCALARAVTSTVESCFSGDTDHLPKLSRIAGSARHPQVICTPRQPNPHLESGTPRPSGHSVPLGAQAPHVLGTDWYMPPHPQFTDKAGFSSCWSISECHYLSNRGILCMGQHQQFQVFLLAHYPLVTAMTTLNRVILPQTPPTPHRSLWTRIFLNICEIYHPA